MYHTKNVMRYVLIIHYFFMFPSPVFDIDVPVLAVCVRGLEVQRYAPGEAALVQEEGRRAGGNTQVFKSAAVAH